MEETMEANNRICLLAQLDFNKKSSTVSLSAKSSAQMPQERPKISLTLRHKNYVYIL